MKENTAYLVSQQDLAQYETQYECQSMLIFWNNITPGFQSYMYVHLHPNGQRIAI